MGNRATRPGPKSKSNRAAVGPGDRLSHQRSPGQRSAVAAQSTAAHVILTDFLARTFDHTFAREPGLDRHPELRDDCFRHYTRVLWLAQRPTPVIGLPLEVRVVGNAGLERQLERLVG